MNILITGGGGDIAQAIANELASDNLVFSPLRGELDVTSSSSVDSYFTKIGLIDTLINCAGYINPSTIKNSEIEDIEKHFAINVIGAIRCTKKAIAQGCSTIINIGSTSAFEGREGWGSYCASKAALLSFTETLAKEGIHSYGIHPAKTKTKMRKSLFNLEDESQLMSPARVGFFVRKVLNNEYSNGSQIILKKDRYYVVPPREVFK